MVPSNNGVLWEKWKWRTLGIEFGPTGDIWVSKELLGISLRALVKTMWLLEWELTALIGFHLEVKLETCCSYSINGVLQSG